jgi:hypothetical protein
MPVRKIFVSALFLLLAALLSAECAQAAEISGRVTVCAVKPLTAVPSAVVLIGRDLQITCQNDKPDKISNPEDILAETKTDSKGWFFLSIPEGSYTLIIWKEHFIPVCMKITVSGKENYPCSFVRDDLPGWKKRHVKLDYQKK